MIELKIPYTIQQNKQKNKKVTFTEDSAFSVFGVFLDYNSVVTNWNWRTNGT